MSEENITKLRKKSIVEKASQNFFLHSEKLKKMLMLKEDRGNGTSSNKSEILTSPLSSPRVLYDEDVDVEEVINSEKSRYERTGSFSPKILLEALSNDEQLHGNYFEYEIIKNEFSLRKERLIGSSLKDNSLKFNQSALKNMKK